MALCHCQSRFLDICFKLFPDTLSIAREQRLSSCPVIHLLKNSLPFQGKMNPAQQNISHAMQSLHKFCYNRSFVALLNSGNGSTLQIESPYNGHIKNVGCPASSIQQIKATLKQQIQGSQKGTTPPMPDSWLSTEEKICRSGLLEQIFEGRRGLLEGRQQCMVQTLVPNVSVVCLALCVALLSACRGLVAGLVEVWVFDENHALDADQNLQEIYG